ncbi:ABC transporter permease [Nonomuraea antimicrobica]
MVNLVLCLVTTVIGTGFVIAGLMNDGAETRRLLQCVSPERADLVVLPVTLPGDLSAPRPPLGALADLESISGVDAVREVGGGVLRTVAPRAELQVIALPKEGLALLPLIEGSLPDGDGQAVLDHETARAHGASVGSTIRAGTAAPIEVSGIIDVDLDESMILRGTLGLTRTAAERLLGPLELQGLQVTLDPGAPPGVVRDQMSRRLGPGFEVYTWQDLAARRNVEAQIMSVGLTVLGLTALLMATGLGYGLYGRLRTPWGSDPVAEHGRGAMRRLLTFDRAFAGALVPTSGMAMATGLLVLLTGMRAELPCANVLAIWTAVALAPIAVTVFALRKAPIAALLRGRQG